MRSAALFLAIVALGIAGLTVLASGDERHVVQTTGVLVIAPVAGIAPGSEACQEPIVTVDDVSAVGFNIGAATPTPRLSVLVRDAESRSVVSRGTIPEGFDAGALVVADLQPAVPAESPVAVCLRNHSTAGIHALVYGDDAQTDLCEVFPGSLACRWRFAHPTSTTSQARVGGVEVPGTMNVVMLRKPGESVLSQVGKVWDRASTFRPGFVTPVLWWLLLALALLAVPLLVAASLRALAAPGRR